MFLRKDAINNSITSVSLKLSKETRLLMAEYLRAKNSVTNLIKGLLALSIKSERSVFFGQVV